MAQSREYTSKLSIHTIAFHSTTRPPSLGHSLVPSPKCGCVQVALDGSQSMETIRRSQIVTAPLNQRWRLSKFGVSSRQKILVGSQGWRPTDGLVGPRPKPI